MSKKENRTVSTTAAVSTFVDHIGRVILGEVVSTTEDSVKVKNPAIVHIGQQPQTGQLQVQTIPYFFREFVDPKQQTQGTVWSFKKNSIVVGEDIKLDPRLLEQYEKIFSANPLPTSNPAPITNSSGKSKAEVIKLFDDEE